MAQSEIARERRNIRRIISRAESRGIRFDIPIDINSATLSELQDLHRNIYDYSATATASGNIIYGKDVVKYENKKRTSHARGKETLDIDFEIDMEENPSETYDENRDKFDFYNAPDYDGEYGNFEPTVDDVLYGDDVLTEEQTNQLVMDKIYDLAREYDESAVDALIQQINLAKSQIGEEAVVRNMVNHSENLIDFATKVAKYSSIAGQNAREIRTRNFSNFVQTLYGFTAEDIQRGRMEKAIEVAAKTGSANIADVLSAEEEILNKANEELGAQRLRTLTPPPGALTFNSLEEGLATDYKRFYYKDSATGEWRYHHEKRR